MKIYRGMELIEGINGGKFPFCNVMKVNNVLIDAGTGIDILKRIKADILVISHTHPDHASGAWLFQNKKVLGPNKFQTDLDSLANRFAGKELAEMWKSFIKGATGMKSFTYEGYEEGIIMKSPEIEAIPVLGHTADHHALLIDQKVLFGADVDLTSFGPFYGNPESDPYLFKKEIEKLFDLDFEVFVSAHTKPVFGKEEAIRRMEKFIRKFDEREERILEILQEPKTVDEIVEISPIYGRKPYFKDMLDYFERNMILKHLERLEKEGKVEKEGIYWVRK
ncbi:MBL fold metallo-hydrolase [Archaeoglobus neptunius]|uniref:MBL fold metallo-hydrolase n=1 Tax=Archaeoglobus neptunius TaxID=2798580 RepID=UPI0019294868|nr:MBL fold metallo-hydrolase [Archaeoglobus neptunius]